MSIISASCGFSFQVSDDVIIMSFGFNNNSFAIMTEIKQCVDTISS